MTAAFQLTPGMVIGGDFEVERILELGGMGAVYTAKQLSTNKLRALKVMHPQLVADPRLRERFEQEARVGAAIDSSHVVEVIAAGVDDASGAPWIAMELLEGNNLSDYAQAHGVLSPDELLETLRQICHALGAAHRADIVHRDIKPENVFVAETKAATTQLSIKVLDFGIAKVAAQAKTTATSTVGSPAWMAPEQTDPKARITPATDCWALGLLSFWLLTGRPFWHAAADPEASVHALMREILFAKVPKASARAEELGVAERLVAGFDDWFRQCVNHDPAMRFQNADELLEGFEHLLQEPTPRAVVHTSIPPGSTSPQSFAHGETMPMTLDEIPASSKPFPLAGKGVATTVDGIDDVPGETKPMPPRAAVSKTAAAMVADASPPTQRAPSFREGRNGRRNMVLAGVGAAAVTSLAFLLSSPLRPTDSVAPAATETEPLSEAPSPSIEIRPEPTQTPPAPAPASASASATASASAPPARAPAVPTKPKPPPFPYEIVNRRMRQAATNAARTCRNYPGPKHLSVSVTWKRDGSIRSVSTGRLVSGAVNQTQFCVKTSFYAIRIGPYSADQEVTLSAAVDIQ